MAGTSVSMFPERATALSPPRVADSKAPKPTCATEDCSAQKGESAQVIQAASQVPSLQPDTHVDWSRDTTQNIDLSEDNRNLQSTAYDASLSVQKTSNHTTTVAPSMHHTDPSLTQLLGASLGPTPLLLTYEDSKEEAHVQQPSKEIVKVSSNEDDKKKLVIFDSPKVLPCVGAFTAQCALCMKWRLIPTKEQYEEIRQSVLEKPFFCSSATSWRPDVSCDDPSDVVQDESHLWAIDRPNIPVAPPGWERQIVIRAAGASKFADVYYVTPTGRKLRSMPEVERFLAEFPEHARAGVKHSQFSFIIPRPLDSKYCRKKTAGPSSNGSESQKRATSTNKGKQPQTKKLSVKRKAFESLSSKEESEELDGRKKLLGGAMIAEKSDKSSGMDSLISQQVVKGSLPPEELMRGLFWPRSGDHASSSGRLGLPTNVSQLEGTSAGKS